MKIRALVQWVVETATGPYGVTTLTIAAWMLLVVQLDVPSATTSSQSLKVVVMALLLPGCWAVAVGVAARVGRHERRRLCSREPVRMDRASASDAGVTFSPLVEKTSKHSSGDGPEYVWRDKDGLLREALAESNDRLILVVGPPASGKSRTAFAATAGVLPDYELLRPMLVLDSDTGEGPALPSARSALQSLLRVGTPRLTRLGTASSARPSGQVLWLDDLGDYLKGRHVTHDELDKWLANRHSVAVATITTDDYRDFTQAATSGYEAMRIIRHCEPVFLESRFSDDEVERAAEAYDIDAEDLRHLPEYFVAARRHVRELEEIQAAGGIEQALVRAAVAWRRAGLPAPIPQAFLGRAARYDCGEVSDADIAAALARVSRPVGEALALLIRDGSGYDVSAFVVSHVGNMQKGRLSKAAVALLAEYLRDRPAMLFIVVCGLALRDQIDQAEEIAGLIDHDPYEGEAQTVIRSFRTRMANPALAKQLWRTEDASLREPGAVDRPPTRAQERASVEELDGRVPSEPWQEDLFDSQLPHPDSGRYVRFYRRLMLRRVLQVTTLVFYDALSVLAGILVVIAARELVETDLGASDFDEVTSFAAVACSITPLAAWWAGLYEASAERARLLLIIKAFSGAAVASAISVALLDSLSLNSGATVWGSFGVAVLICWCLRSAYDAVSRNWVKKNALAPRVLLLGPPDVVATRGPALVRALQRPMLVVGYLSDAPDARDPYCLGTYDDLVTVIRRHYIQRCAVLDDRLPPAEVLALADSCHGESVAIETLFGTEEIVLGMWREPGSELPVLEIKPLALSPGSRIVKRAFDLVTLLVLSPLILTLLIGVGILVKIDSPRERMILRTRRVGRGQRDFRMLRFRTRRRIGPVPSGGRDVELAAPSRIGRFVERIGLDELPQFVNVIRGQMSVVGPRPFPSSVSQPEDRDFERRYNVRPGITGLWQLSRRGGLSERDLLEMDLIYLRFWSVFQDLALVLKTFSSVARRLPRSVRLRSSSAPGHTGAEPLGETGD